VDDKIPTTTKETTHKTTSKEMPLPLEIHQTPAFNAEKWDILPETAQNVTKAISTTAWPT